MLPSLVRSLSGSGCVPVPDGEPVAPGGARATIARLLPLLPLFNPGNFAVRTDNLFGSIVSVNTLRVPPGSALRLAGLTEVAGPDDTWIGKPFPSA
jgi:hypothetical protein